MRTTTSVLTAGLGILLLSLSAPGSRGQAPRVPSRIVEKIDDTRTVQLKGNVHPLARPANDRGAVADSQPMSRMLLMLQRSPQQDAALQQLIDAQQTKGSGSYHAWLTPEQFGKQFGPSDADVQTVTDWLTQQGFQVAKVSAGRTAIEFSGTVGQVRNAFHTEIHQFATNGETHFANVSEPSVPEALAPVVRGPVTLHNFPKHSYSHNKGTYRWNRQTGEITPEFTFTTPQTGVTFALGPGDFTKIYNVPAGATGAGQTIAIVGDSNINAQDVIAYRSMFGLSTNNFTQANNVLVNGPDPGLNGDEGEADLDVELAGAIAPQANILLVTSANTTSNPTQVTAGIDLSALYVVDNDPAVNGVPASVLSESFGECEPTLGANQNIFYNTLWQEAAAEGITVVVSTGDSGPSACDPDYTQTITTAAVDGLAVNGIASTPYNTAVGGTDFDPSATTSNSSTFWNLTVGTVNSALGYIPETTWDDSNCAFNFPTACANVDPNGNDLAAAGGGISNCGFWTSTNGSCNHGYPIPAYQASPHNSVSTQYRSIPDISSFASNGNNNVAVIVCQSDENPQGSSCNLSSPYTDFNLVGGTSAATPAFAAIVALLNQQTGARQGNVNYGLYGLAFNDSNYTNGNCNASVGNTPAATCVYNDVSKGNIGVACVLGATSNADGSTNWCNPGNGTNTNFGVTVINGTNTVAYGARAGYDAATGLGSVNVTNLLNRWSSFSRTSTNTTLSNLSGGTISGATFTAKVTVTPSTATGTVAFTALASDQTTILAVFGGLSSSGAGGTVPFKLSGGTAQVQTNLLPPGTAYISASYSGDVNNAASTSMPVMLSGTVTGNNITPRVQVSLVTFDSNNNPVLSTSGSVSYGSPYVLNVVVSNGGQNCGYGYPYTLPPFPCPTGKIAMTDNGQPLNDFPSGPSSNATNIAKLSNQGGLVEDGNVQLPGGSHSITASFTSADTNFTNGNGNTVAVTVTPAQTAMILASNLNVISSGESVTLTAVVGSLSNSSQGPTGSVQFTNNGTNLGQAVTCKPAGAVFNPDMTLANGASCSAQLTTSIAALFPPPADGPRQTMPLLPLLVALASLALFALGWRWIPQNRRRAYVYAGFLAFALLAVGIAGCGGGGGSSGGGQTVTIKAVYPGDTNYATSSNTTAITVQ